MAGHGRTLERFERFPGFPELPMTIRYTVLRSCPLQEALAWNRNQQELTRTTDIEVYDKSYSSLQFFTDSHPHGRRKRATDATVAKRWRIDGKASVRIWFSDEIKRAQISTSSKTVHRFPYHILSHLYTFVMADQKSLQRTPNANIPKRCPDALTTLDPLSSRLIFYSVKFELWFGGNLAPKLSQDSLDLVSPVPRLPRCPHWGSRPFQWSRASCPCRRPNT